MTLHFLLVLSPVLGLFLLSCLSSHVSSESSIVASQKMTNQTQSLDAYNDHRVLKREARPSTESSSSSSITLSELHQNLTALELTASNNGNQIRDTSALNETDSTSHHREDDGQAPISIASTSMTAAHMPVTKNDTFIPIKTVSNASRGTSVPDMPHETTVQTSRTTTSVKQEPRTTATPSALTSPPAIPQTTTTTALSTTYTITTTTVVPITAMPSTTPTTTTHQTTTTTHPTTTTIPPPTTITTIPPPTTTTTTTTPPTTTTTTTTTPTTTTTIPPTTTTTTTTTTIPPPPTTSTTTTIPPPPTTTTTTTTTTIPPTTTTTLTTTIPSTTTPNITTTTIDTSTVEEKNPSPTSPEAPSSQATSRNAIVPSTFTAEVSTKRLDRGTNTNKAIIDVVAGGPLTRQLVDTSTLLAVLLFGLIFFLVTVVLFLTQAYESYRTKDYTQVDFLMNGMYSDSGV